MEKGKRDREHRDTGRQRSEPEEGKHARQPEGPTGGRKSRPQKRSGGGWLRGPKTRSLTWTAGVLSSDNCRITAYQVGAEVDQTAGGGETWRRFIAATTERYPASDGCYTVP